MLKVMIVDDETLARSAISLLLENQTDIAEPTEACDGVDAMAKFALYKPDIVFIDVEMPGMDGFELAANINEQCELIFVTAYDKYALDAHAYHAFDYLLKPIDKVRFYSTLEAARQRIRQRTFGDYKKYGDLIERYVVNQETAYRSRITVRDPGRIRFIEVEQIIYISGAGNYAELHLADGGSVLHRETLSALEAELDPKDFVRINRSAIVRRSSVSELRTNDNGDYCVMLTTGAQILLSRRSKGKLEQLIG